MAAIPQHRVDLSLAGGSVEDHKTRPRPRRKVMITVHHLDDSRSQRILWLLEELGVPYEITHHKRDPETRLAPPALKLIHPLGKSPVIEDEGRVVAEAGAIVDYVYRRIGNR